METSCKVSEGIAKHPVKLYKKNTHACEVYMDMGIIEHTAPIYINAEFILMSINNTEEL